MFHPFQILLACLVSLRKSIDQACHKMCKTDKAFLDHTLPFFHGKAHTRAWGDFFYELVQNHSLNLFSLPLDCWTLRMVRWLLPLSRRKQRNLSISFGAQEIKVKKKKSVITELFGPIAEREHNSRTGYYCLWRLSTPRQAFDIKFDWARLLPHLNQTWSCRQRWIKKL